MIITLVPKVDPHRRGCYSVRMDLQKLQTQVEQLIPITRAMGVRILEWEPLRAVIRVPLQPNHNHKGTAFGGSLYSACTVACYALAYGRQLESSLSDRDLVILRGEIEYLKAVREDFLVEVSLAEPDWRTLLERLAQKKSARLPLRAQVRHQNDTLPLCKFSGEFAFIPA